MSSKICTVYVIQWLSEGGDPNDWYDWADYISGGEDNIPKRINELKKTCLNQYPSRFRAIKRTEEIIESSPNYTEG